MHLKKRQKFILIQKIKSKKTAVCLYRQNHSVPVPFRRRGLQKLLTERLTDSVKYQSGNFDRGILY